MKNKLWVKGVSRAVTEAVEGPIQSPSHGHGLIANSILRPVVSLLVAAILLTGCTNARLSTIKPTSQQVDGESPYYLAAPKNQNGPLRYIFFVDMSYSMVAGTCATDVNNPSEPTEPKEFDVVKATNPGLPCASDKGVDPQADRLKMVETWLNEIKDQQDTQVIVMAFSGGFMETRRRNARIPKPGSGGPFGPGSVPEERGFYPVADGIDYVKQLMKEHENDLKAATNGTGKNRYMGTSVPAPFLTRLTQFVYSDMKDLQSKGLLTAARYQMVYLSDGVPNPRAPHAQTALNLKQCPHSCLGKDSTASCTEICRGYVQDIYDFWGNPSDNEFDHIKMKLKTLLSLPTVAGEGRLDLSLILLHPERLEARYKNEANNYLLAFQKQIPEAKWLSWDKPQIPFSLTRASNDVQAYKLTGLFALNPNYRLNAFGDVEADSDGDGLFDSEEKTLSTEARKPRSQGFCLDSIATQDAYKTKCQADPKALSCDPQWDSDGDGLNECEEKILGTDPMDFDSDGDFVPDGLEITYRFYLNRNDRFLDSNADNILNVSNLVNNLMPHHYPERVSKNEKIGLEKEYIGNRTDVLSSGLKVQSEGYRVKILNAPVGTTQGLEKNPILYLNPKHTENSLIPPSWQIIGGPTSGTTNEILVLARIIDANDPFKAIWGILRIPANTDSPLSNFQVNLSKIDTLPVRDPVTINETQKSKTGAKP